MKLTPKRWPEILPYDTIMDPRDGAHVMLLPYLPGMPRFGRGPGGELRRFTEGPHPVMVVEPDMLEALTVLHQRFHIDVIGEV